MGRNHLLQVEPDDHGRPVRSCRCRCHDCGVGDCASSLGTNEVLVIALHAHAGAEVKLSDPVAAVFACRVCAPLHIEGMR